MAPALRLDEALLYSVVKHVCCRLLLQPLKELKRASGME